MKKITSLLLAIMMTIGLSPINNIVAQETNTTTVKIESTSAMPGSTVDVAISINDNPGIASMGFTLSFDDSLTLIEAKNGEAFSDLTITLPPQLKKTGSVSGSCRFAWLGSDNVVENGVILYLKFKVSDNVELNKNCVILLTCEKDDVLNDNREAVDIKTQNGKVSIISYKPGDVDNSGIINMLDVLTLCQFYVDDCQYDPNGYAVNINPESGDVDANGKINMLDVLTLCQFYVDGCKYDPDGYGVMIYPGKQACEHSMQHFAAKDATCTEPGNSEYWYCEKCNDYFADPNGNDIITLDYTIIVAKGHHKIVDEGMPATTTDYGYTAGVWCDQCHTWISGHEIIEPIAANESNILYRHYARSKNEFGEIEIVYDEYLSTHDIVNPNPNTYIEGVGVDELIEGVKNEEGKQVFANGYRFLGWYEKPEEGAKRVYSISNQEKGNKILYGVWSKEEYTIIFDNTSMKLPNTSMKYTVDQKIPLEIPSIDRYVFLGWTTDSDEIVTEIKPGTTGNITLHSNWTSKRNLTKPVAKLGDPLIIEDTIEGRILFAYEIGQIENVPLYTIKNLPSAGGVVSVYTETVTDSIGSSDASAIVKAIDHVTTDSTAWTLSEDWNETTHIEDSVMQEHASEVTNWEEVGKTASNTYTLTSNEYDNTVVKTNEGSVATTTQYNTKDVNTRETWESEASLKVSDTQSEKYTTSANVSAEIGVSTGSVSAKVGSSMEASTEISNTSSEEASTSATISHENTSNTKTGTEKITVEDNTKTTTNDKGWDKSESSTSSSSSSFTKHEEETLSEKIAKEYTYGQSYAKGGTNSQSADWSTSTGESNQYSSTLTYFNSEEKTEGVSYEINGEKDGSYRLVRAGIVHVFAVVIYDVATNKYSVSTYDVLDDETYTYIDYSATSAAKFDDNENGVLPFEIPYFVNDYVNGRIVGSEGLVYNNVNGSTGKYNGSQTSVVIPEFISVNNLDDSYSAVTIRHLSSNTFMDNTALKSVLLSNYIREIPDNAFNGCSSLQLVYGSEINSIGDYAFNGCSSLGDFKVASTVEEIGKEAFKDVNSIEVEASNLDVVVGAINSGAKNVKINVSAIADKMSDVTLEIPDTIETFELQGGRNTFKGLKIKSDAKTTILNGITIKDSTGIPLEISSENLTLNQVTVESPSYVLLLKGNAPVVSLYGTSVLSSSSNNAVVCRNVEFKEMSSILTNQLSVTGDVLYYGVLKNSSLVKFINKGEFKEIGLDEFNAYIKGCFTIEFDANGGIVSKDDMIAYVGSPIGELPIPSYDYHDFDGWYTEKENGYLVSSDTTFNDSNNITLYAHWELKPLSDWVLVDDVPEEADILKEKWTYTRTQTTESTNSSLEGWQSIGDYWSQIGNDSKNYASFPSGFDTSHWIYTSFDNSPYESYENSNYKCEVSNTWSGYVYYKWDYNAGYSNTTKRSVSPVRLDSGTDGYAFKYFHANLSSTDHPYLDNYYCNNYNMPSYNCSSEFNSSETAGPTPRFFRFDYYTSSYIDYQKIYKYKKITPNLESETEIRNGGEISDVQKWVQYRAK